MTCERNELQKQLQSVLLPLYLQEQSISSIAEALGKCQAQI